MQYWLINYDATCPSGWFTDKSDCYQNSSAKQVTTLTAGQLATVMLSGSATSGGNDGVRYYTTTNAGSRDTGLGMAAGTRPAIQLGT